jgi:hypothetical protein
MQINVTTNIAQVQKALKVQAKQVPFAMSVALNRTAEWAETNVRKEMTKVFDRPTRYFLRSLRVIRSTKTKLQATVWFKDRNSAENSSDLVRPHIQGGGRATKPMEQRLQSAGLMPAGWRAVPGEAATIDAFGNMSKGQITQLLNVLGTYKEAGYNKANAATRARLAKGNVKKGVYGFEYFVNPVGSTRGKHLQPGVYKRVNTPFGSSLKPVLIFVRRAQYKVRLDFEGIVRRTVDQRFPAEFDAAFDRAVRTARP